ncbi:MAG: DASS family sodium-coupled anion symporter [Balneola sp.]|nr:DASS family sodium-coupled anion symporter [Balneola sp.]MBO6652083.1 DASS family sodium-coupled anion symporter [Balneola sp.]MBO6711576.1 DASS family sodium-coupled anion symporter [Balneola sp.]MBO6799772.1 DASS family sodium-coupled anion symporter [Balneola sp.]MBO6870787.1 DASS family sodium-coupled anion symporter [Balneola sp.]
MQELGNRLGLIGGILVFVILLFLPVPEGLSDAAWKTAAVTILMGIWWITEAIPISATALLPIVLFPVLGVFSIGDATSPYANPLIFLFMGGFVIALAMEKWNLHKRIAISIVNFVGIKPSSIIIGFIIASAFLSMWVSNTATAIMMLPIAMSILELLDKNDKSAKINFEIVLVLTIAYACNIGGMGTLIGTPPNALLAGFVLENYNIEISFLDWMMVGVPIMLVSLPLMYFILTKFVYPIKIKELPGGKELIQSQMERLGNISNQEKKVAVVFVSAALLWMFRPLLSSVIPGLSDAGIAIGAAVAFFMIPANSEENRFLLKWSDTKRLPWGVLILFGGGLSMASAISSTGLATWIGSGIGSLNTWPIILIILIVIALIVFLTEMTSNTASTAAFLPILASVAIGLGENPFLLAIPTVLGASCAFMLPVATPPNAIVYGSGKISIPEMSKAGLWLNIMFILLLTVASLTLVSWVFGIEIGVLPEWVK